MTDSSTKSACVALLTTESDCVQTKSPAYSAHSDGMILTSILSVNESAEHDMLTLADAKDLSFAGKQ